MILGIMKGLTLLLLLLVTASALVRASVNDDLVFDQDGSKPHGEAPLIETRQPESLLRRIRRGIWDIFGSAIASTTTTETPAFEENNPEDEVDNAPPIDPEDEAKPRPSNIRAPGHLERTVRESGENAEEAEEENEIGNVAEARREPHKFRNTDDEDLAGSGEVEGSAVETDAGVHYRPHSRGEIRYYRITLTVGEPYRREYADRSSREYKELSGNLTKPLEALLNRHIPNENHHVNVIKISPTADSFTSQVTLDIGSTFTDELEVQSILEEQLQYHSLDDVQVLPDGFTFRIFQAERDVEECDSSTELRCRNGACVPLDSRCDGVPQCEDSSDELDCPKTTTHLPREIVTEPYSETVEPEESSTLEENEETGRDYDESTRPFSTNKCRADDTVRCSDGSRYICSVQRCDGVQDCDDGDDEVGCPHPGCSPGEFACDVSRCILESHRCNFVKECDDGSDEHDCSYPACTAAQFKCRNGQCINSSAHCDGVEDCLDGTDEFNCPCREGQFECTPGFCVSASKRCDGVMDCNDGRDEENCRHITRCRPDEFECSDGGCVSQTARCDGRSDCRDRSDEYNCNVTTCSGDQFRCLDGTCIGIDKRCNQNIDCRNGEDESQCGCGGAEFRCTDGRCIGYELQCNGVEECSDGSDERDCEKHLWRNVYNDENMLWKFVAKQRGMKNSYMVAVRKSKKKQQEDSSSERSNQVKPSRNNAPAARPREHYAKSPGPFLRSLKTAQNATEGGAKRSRIERKRAKQRTRRKNVRNHYIRSAISTDADTLAQNDSATSGGTPTGEGKLKKTRRKNRKRLGKLGTKNRGISLSRNNSADATLSSGIASAASGVSNSSRDEILHSVTEEGTEKQRDETTTVARADGTEGLFIPKLETTETASTTTDGTTETGSREDIDSSDSARIVNMNWSSEEDLDKHLRAVADEGTTEEGSRLVQKFKRSSNEEVEVVDATTSSFSGIFVDATDQGRNSIEDPSSREEIYNYKTKKRGKFSKYFHEYLEGSVSPSFSTTPASSRNNSADGGPTAKLESELFESNGKGNKVDMNLLSRDRLLKEGHRDSSLTTDESFRKNVDKCTSKCAEYWRRAYEREKKKAQAALEGDTGDGERIDSGLISVEEVTPLNSDDNCTDSYPDDAESRKVLVPESPRSFTPAIRTTESPDLVETVVDPRRNVTRVNKKRRKNKQPGDKGRKKKKHRGKNKLTTVIEQRETTSTFDRTTWRTSTPSDVDSTIAVLETTAPSYPDVIYKEFQSNEADVASSTSSPEAQGTTWPEKCQNRNKMSDRESREDCEEESTVAATTQRDEDEEATVKTFDNASVSTIISQPSSAATERIQCDRNEFLCDDNVCVRREQLCNGVADCEDNSDETYCDDGYEAITPRGGSVRSRGDIASCAEWEFACDGVCIGRNLVCDNAKNCEDGSDEADCGRKECPDGKLPCDNGVCINKHFFCDSNVDCHDGSDERNCVDTAPRPVGCHRDEFTCRDGSCIPRSSVCNGRVECPQEDDEANCPGGCGKDQFQCANGDCIRADQKCNRYIDCADGSDEPEECERPDFHPMPGRCPAGYIMCVTDKDCVPQSSICNGVPECRDRSDEENCHPSREPSHLNLKTYPSEQVIKESREVVFQCRDEGPQRARVRWLRGNNLPLPPGSRDINGRLEIPNIQLDHSGPYICEVIGYPPSTPGHQVNVYLTVEKFEPPATTRPHVCKYEEATCSNGDCIPKSYVCNGRVDCTDGSDEMRCNPHGCEPNEFRCNNTECVSKLWRCDGDKDCSDGSDEESCAPSKPGSACRYTEYACASNDQCIPKSYQCDMERDCLDGSDEIGCSPVYIVKPPPPMITLQRGEVLVIVCTAIGVPTPEINWRLNWGHVPSKCKMTSVNGTGTLTCPDIQPEDQGAYSCEGLNSAGFVFAIPDAIVMVNKTEGICRKGTFNAEARSVDECIACFCFGVATECHSANLFTYQIPPPFDRHRVIAVKRQPQLKILNDVSRQYYEVTPIGRDGVHLYYTDSMNRLSTDNNVPYFALPENYHGNQLKSYGGYLKYRVRYNGTGLPNSEPSVIISGNNYVLLHRGKELIPDYDNEETVRFFQGEWYKQDGWNEVPATREDIMMTLANVDNILIKVLYDSSPVLDIQLTHIVMDTADARNTGLGSASYVEECQCPSGYGGLSCEECAPGYLRRESGPWLGQCYRDEPPCPPGYYGDPSRNIACQMCPCPLTNPSNQFARTCHLGSDGQPTCDCPPGYVGRRCEQCDVGYQGNPLIPGDMCVPVRECDPDGSLSLVADSNTGKCRCKQYATGLTCNQCKANTFNLASKNQFGCIGCFCMGITNKCVSSNWYRNDIRVSFTNSVRDFSLIESKIPDAPAIVHGIRLDTITREIIYNEFPNRGNNDVYYWQLPSIFLGNQVTSYGGSLKYTVRYVPAPGGQSSKNNAADVELISANDINLLYFSRESLEPNTPQTFTVPLLEQHWQRNDGTQADREHLLMALADIRAIRIKATYTTHTDEAALSLVSLDTAEKYNTGRARAVEVEECSCPVGYKGLSCEDCDVGFTRASQGLYLGICEPCSCNGHSSQCNPDTGICENCAHHTTGEVCEICEPGYEGDATQGTPHDCIYRGSTPDSCVCNEAGSRSDICVGERCDCKRNVEGPTCNRCRPATFGLSANNPDGCSQCYCSGVTDQCHESSLYIQQIPVWVYDNQHGFTLTDSTRQEIIDDGFELNFAMNEIRYRYPDSRGRRLFWSLPAIFTGNKVKSYGGNLTLTQHVTAHPGAQSYKDQDIILIGSGVTLFWTNPTDIQPDVPLTYSVPFIETEWRRLTTEGPRVASRVDLMTVLSNLEAILVRATHSDRMTATYISDISLDTAVEHQTGNRRAVQVEVCRCPTGYVGTSCESCARGYYRDTNDRSASYLGACSPCPCNNNEESCEMTRNGQVKCHCLPGHVGQYCQDTEGPAVSTTTPYPTIAPPRILVYIKGPEFQIVETGSTVRYHCSGRSMDNEFLRVKWEKEGGRLPTGRSVDDSQGLLIIRDVKVSDSGIYVCQVSNGVHIGYKNVTLTVGGVNSSAPRAMVSPAVLQVLEGEPAEFRCDATGNPPPQIEWIRVYGPMNPEVIIQNGIWTLRAVSKNDAAEYKCVARNNAGVDERTAVLYVRDNPRKPPPTGIRPTITPPQWTGTVGETIQITCTSSQESSVIHWVREGNLPLPSSSDQRDGVLTITSPTQYDSGVYVCIATTYVGTQTNNTINVTVTPRRVAPSVNVKPEKQTVPQGSVAEIRCTTNGEPGVQVRWNKYLEQMGPNAQQVGDTLRIFNIQIADRGVYVCRVTGSTGSHEASAIVEVEPRETPRVEIYPKDVPPVTLGGSTDLQCRAVAGIPMPELQWSHQDGRPFPHNVKQLPGGVLRLSNITENDGGAYVCAAVNSMGSNSAVVYIEVQSVPVIMISPRSGILNVKPGDRVRLVCSATGYPQPTVAWSKHVNVVEFKPDSIRATPLNAVYEIYTASPSDEGSYTCHANNAAGIVEERVYIRVEDNNDIYPPCRGDVPCPDNKESGYPDHGDHDEKGVDTIPEDNLKIPNGGKVEMRCHVHASDGKRIFLDWKRTDNRPLPDDSIVHNGVLNIPSVDKSAAGEYVCSGMDQAGTLLFRAKTHLEVLSPPRIVLIPPRQTVRSGENPSIICSTTGDDPKSIEWAAIGRNLPYSVSNKHGVLQFHGITYSDAGKYVCKATNDAGTAEAVAEVLVNEHPYEDAGVRAAQRDVVTFVGEPVRLRCISNERATIHWSREGQALPSNNRIEEDYLELPRARPEDSGRYICQIQTARGVSSDYINLNVSPTVVPAVSVEVSQDPVNIGDTIDIRCACSVTHNPRYRWSRPNHPHLPDNAREYGNILKLSNVAVSDSGLYRCTADTPEGVFEQDYNLVVHGGNNDAPAIETKLAPHGSSLEMDCRPNLEQPLKFHWSKLGGLLPHNAQTFDSKLKLVNVKAEDAGTYVCTVNNDHENIEIPTVLVVTGVVPYFSQAPQSFIALPPLPDSYLKFNIEISFKPESYDGIILYNDESNRGDGDFILLSLVRGYPQFSFDLGSGPAIIRGSKPVTLSEWHTIKLQRNRKEGTMLVDGEGPYKGVAAGRKQGLDLKALLFVGGVPSDNIINKYAEINSGFVGCISRLVIGEKDVDLIGDQTDSIGITNCETCAENPCNNGGVCQEAAAKNGYTCLCRAGYSGKHCDYVGQSCYPGACGDGKCVDKETGFECYCPYGRTGSRCENTMKIYEPAFHDEKSFIAHETPKALRRARMNPSNTHNRLRARNAQVRKPRSRQHHHNKSHHTNH